MVRQERAIKISIFHAYPLTEVIPRQNPGSTNDLLKDRSLTMLQARVLCAACSKGARASGANRAEIGRFVPNANRVLAVGERISNNLFVHPRVPSGLSTSNHFSFLMKKSSNALNGNYRLF
jgi:hypothetical protein